MFRRLRHRSFRSNALWVLALLLTCVWQPALMAASEVHEASHFAIAGHAHDEVHEEAGIPADEPLQADASGFHGLMHLGHCCSQPPAAVFAAVTLHLELPPPPALPEPPARRARVHFAEVLRPPIVA